MDRLRLNGVFEYRVHGVDGSSEITTILRNGGQSSICAQAVSHAAALREGAV
jgi:hypothetical protein